MTKNKERLGSAGGGRARSHSLDQKEHSDQGGTMPVVTAINLEDDKDLLAAAASDGEEAMGDFVDYNDKSSFYEAKQVFLRRMEGATRRNSPNSRRRRVRLEPRAD